jgi:hypothetical protein
MKTNNFKIIIAAIFAVIGLNVSAQKCGVYKTYEDTQLAKGKFPLLCIKRRKNKTKQFFQKSY